MVKLGIIKEDNIMSDNTNNGFPVPEEPLTREEQYLSAIAGVTEATEIPDKPLTRVEAYLNKIVEDGGDITDKLEAGTNIVIEETSDGKAKISASGEVSSEDTYARAEISAILDGASIDSFADVEAALTDKVEKVSGKGLSANDFTNELKSKLDGIAAGAEVNVQADWNQTTDTADDYIKNKPTLGTAAAAATSDFATAAQGTKADSAIQGVKVGSTTLTPDSGKAVTITKNDITGLGIPAQDTTYVFEGTYNASTNKAATMADIKDGILTGYAQTSGNVAATDKVIEAIGKVEKKADDNKNNISTANAELIELVDSGAKNELELITPWGSGITNNPNLTVTLNSDQTITLNGSVTTSGVIVISNTISGKLGKYLFNTTARSKLVAYAQPSWTTVAYDYTGEGGLITDNGNILISLNVTAGETYSNAAIKPMICSKAAWDVSQKFVPYRPPYEETVKQVAENENNILLNKSALTDIINSGGKNSFDISTITYATSVTVSGTTMTMNDTDSKQYLNFMVQRYQNTTAGSTIANLNCQTNTIYAVEFTKDNTFNTLSMGHNGSQKDGKFRTDVSNLTDGVTYVIQFEVINCNKDYGNFSWKNIMITPKSLYQISDDYDDYCPTLAELYALVKSYHP